MTTVAAVRNLVWPAERFYWALVDASVLPDSARPTNEQLRFLFEPELPEPLDDVHAVFVRIGGDKYVACALPKATLAVEVPREALTLTPASLPPLLVENIGADFDRMRLNLLVGDHEPKLLRLARRRSKALALDAALALVALLVVGIERRRFAAEAEVASLRVARDRLIEAQIGAPSPGNPLPAALRLEAELRLLRQTRTETVQTKATRDAAERLATLLARWPDPSPVKTDSILVGEQAIHVQGSVPTSDDAQALSTALGPQPGLRTEFPSVQAGTDGFRFTLEWRRDAGGSR